MNTGRVALITGGAKRVGRAIVERLSQSGFAVAFTYHHSDSDADALAKFTGAIAINADLTDPLVACQQIDVAFTKSFSELHLLVNNASLFQSDPDQPNQTIQPDLSLNRRLMSIHVESPLLLCKRFEHRLRQSHGHIVNMVDLLAEKPMPKYLAYCASKAALLNLTKGLAREFAPQVTVNGIAPGVVDWPGDYPQAERDNYLKRVPLARAGTPKDVADTVHFLATEGAYITGQILRLDGGRSIM